MLLYLNDGVGDPFDGLAAVRIGPDTDDVTAVALGDLDGDTRPDLVVGRSGDTTIAYLNDGTGQFTLFDGTLDLGTDARSIAIGDVDRRTSSATSSSPAAPQVTLYENLGVGRGDRGVARRRRW